MCRPPGAAGPTDCLAHLQDADHGGGWVLGFGFDEHRAGTIEPGKRADLVALQQSPWDQPEGIAEIDVAMTVVDGGVVFDAR